MRNMLNTIIQTQKKREKWNNTRNNNFWGHTEPKNNNNKRSKSNRWDDLRHRKSRKNKIIDFWIIWEKNNQKVRAYQWQQQSSHHLSQCDTKIFEKTREDINKIQCNITWCRKKEPHRVTSSRQGISPSKKKQEEKTDRDGFHRKREKNKEKMKKEELRERV